MRPSATRPWILSLQRTQRRCSIAVCHEGSQPSSGNEIGERNREASQASKCSRVGVEAVIIEEVHDSEKPFGRPAQQPHVRLRESGVLGVDSRPDPSCLANR